MGFWANKDNAPKRNYRFLMSIEGLGGAANQWIIKKADKPRATVGEAQHQYLNHTFYYPGRVTWEPLAVTLVDPVSPNAAGLLALLLGLALRALVLHREALARLLRRLVGARGGRRRRPDRANAARERALLPEVLGLFAARERLRLALVRPLVLAPRGRYGADQRDQQHRGGTHRCPPWRALLGSAGAARRGGARGAPCGACGV